MPTRPSGVEAERKIVTVLFCDLVGSTARADGADPEDVQATLGPYQSLLRTELQRYGGTVEKFIGDAVMAVFGAPLVHEDDAERAVRSGLRILDAIDELNASSPGRDLEVRIGIATGPGLVRLDARPDLGEGSVVGDVVNTAARLQTAAPVGSVVVGEATHRLTSEQIDYESLEPVSVKGKGQPLAWWRATGARSRIGADFAASGTPFVGRVEDLAALQAAFARAVREQSVQLVTVTGEPGIGKSRLLRELLALIDSSPGLVRWRQGHCLPYGDGIAFWALGEICKAEAGILPTDDQEATRTKLRSAVDAVTPEGSERSWLLARLAPLVALPVDPSQASSQEESFAAWRRFLEALAADRPLVLVIEDAHWADPALLAFIEHVLDWSDGVALLIVVTARPELYDLVPNWGGGKRNATTVALRPLADIEAAALLAALLQSAVLPTEVHAALLERAGGNPLYAEQFVRLLSERGFLSSDGTAIEPEGASDLPLPDAVGALIAARLDTLPPERKALLADAAVLGTVFWSEGLSALGSRDSTEISEALRDLAAAQFIRRTRRSDLAGQDQFAFWHGLVREVAYGTLPRRARATRHLAAADWLERVAGDRLADHSELLAHHYVTAIDLLRLDGDAVGADALLEPTRRVLRTAGERAFDLNAFAAAGRHFTDAIKLSRDDDADRPWLLFGLGRAQFHGEGDGEQALSLARDALLAVGERELAAEAETMLSSVWWMRGKRVVAFAHLQNAVELLATAGPTRAKAAVLVRLGLFRNLEEQPDGAIAVADEALSIAESLGLDELRASALGIIGTARSAIGDDRGIADLEQAIDIAVHANTPQISSQIRANLASTLIDRGDLVRGFELQAQARDTAKRFGLGARLRWLGLEQVLEDYWRGRWHAATTRADSFVAESERSENRYVAVYCRLVLGHIKLAHGDLSGASNEGALALAVAREAEDPQILHPSLAFSARSLAAQSRVVEASAHADELLQALRLVVDSAGRGTPAQSSQWTVDLAVVAADLGRGQDFREIASALRPTSPWLDAARLFAAGNMTGAAERYAAIGSVPDAVYAWTHAADQLFAGGHESDARTCLAQALSFCRSVGADEDELLRPQQEAEASP